MTRMRVIFRWKYSNLLIGRCLESQGSPICGFESVCKSFSAFEEIRAGSGAELFLEDIGGFALPW